MHCLAYSKHLHCRFLVMFEMFVICYLCREAQIASPWSVMSCWSYDVQFCCSSLRVLINMFSSDGSCSADISSYESNAEMCSCSMNSKEFFEPDLDPLPDSALATSDSDPDPLPDSASFASADSPEDRSKKSIPQELPKNLPSGKNAGSA